MRRPRNFHDDIRQEIDAHVGQFIDENIAAGMTPAEARAAAHRRFGNATLTQELAAESWTIPWFEAFRKDVRYALRGLRRAPGFAIAVILTLALGIGANTAIFSVVFNVLLRPLPYPSAERMVTIGEANGKARVFSVTWINFQHWRAENHAFDNLAAFNGASHTLTGHGDALLTRGIMATHTLFPLLSVRPQLGHFFGESDDRIGAAPVAVLSWGFWTANFSADPAVLGSTISLDGKGYQVIGVASRSLTYFGDKTDYYLPLGPIAGTAVKRSAHGNISVLGLLKPGMSMEAGREDLNQIMRRLAIGDPGPETDHRAYTEYLLESVSGGVRKTLYIFMGAAGLLLALACANVASLLLVHGTSRARELAIRSAIGAGRSRLVRQLLTENLVLAFLGGALGLGVAQACLRALIWFAPPRIPRLTEITLNVPVLLFAAAATILTGLLAGLAPMFAARRIDVSRAMREGAPSSGSSRLARSLRGGLVIGEIAITLVLAFGSGLLIRSLIAAQTSYPGFDSRNVLSFSLQIRYKNPEQVRQFYSRLTADLGRLPGVESAGAVSCAPAGGDCGDWW